VRIVWGILGYGGMIAALIFNTINAIRLWDGIGGVLSVMAFPVMFFVVPIAVLMQGEWPIYWLLLPIASLFVCLASRGEEY
jgi:hypothetical protein